MKQITLRVSDQQEHTLKKSATKTKKSVVGYIRYLIDCDARKQSQDIPPELKPLPTQGLPDFQPGMIELLYRNLFLTQVGFGKMYPDEFKAILDVSGAEAKKAARALTDVSLINNKNRNDPAISVDQ